jgi:ParB family chromosome partitioning protein
MSEKNTSKSGGVNLDGLDALDALAGFGEMSIGALIDGPAAQPTPPAAPAGVPLMAKLADIEEDARQIRKRFNLDEMRASIRENIATGRPPYKVPLIVKPHPTKPGKWKLCDGARRLRSGRLENVGEAPIVVDENFDDFDQVVVNLQRDGNTAAEIADFIEMKLTEGFKKGEIAKRLGMSAGWLSKHVALIGMPESIRLAYDEERLNDVEAMYLLTTNYQDHADAIDELCINGTELISKYTVMALLGAWKNPAVSEVAAADPPAAAAAGADAGMLDAAAAGAANDTNAGQNLQEGPAAMTGAAGAGEARHDQAGQRPAPGGAEVPEAPAASTSTPKPPAEPGKLRKAIVQIRHDKRPGRLLLDRRAPVGLAWIKYDDDGAEVEIEISTASLVGIVEGA